MYSKTNTIWKTQCSFTLIFLFKLIPYRMHKVRYTYKLCKLSRQILSTLVALIVSFVVGVVSTTDHDYRDCCTKKKKKINLTTQCL